jgi:hypothetical protein
MCSSATELVERLVRSPAFLAALCFALGGCSDPYADPASTPRSDPRSPSVSHAPTTRSSPPPGDARPAEPVPAATALTWRYATPSPQLLARAYARDAVNWDWHTLSDRLERLREQSAGRLSAELKHAIRASRIDESLARDRPASEGTVASVTVRGDGTKRRLLVVTRERETASGVEPLGPATYRVYLGEAERTTDGWRIIAWSRAP